MLKKKYAAMFLSLALTVSGLAGCSVSNADGTGAESGSLERSAFFESVVYGEVSAVGSNTLTIRPGMIENSDETGEETAGEDGALESAEEMSALSGEDSADREKPEDIPEGGQMGVRLALTGQEVTIQLKDETVIKRVSFGEGEAQDGPEGILSDISEGDIVSVAFDEDVFAQSITVLSSENE
ncbi:MAG: hypothetical protein LUE16_06895 [Lachnospiraceae bacterium]|nr:hypothetical protein [Lachnospiraceae bacterium]